MPKKRKFTREQAWAIRDAAAHGESIASLMRRYEVRVSVIRQILTGVTYADTALSGVPDAFVRVDMMSGDRITKIRITFTRWLYELLGEPLYIAVSRLDHATILLRAGSSTDYRVLMSDAIPTVVRCAIPVADLDAVGWCIGTYPAYFHIWELAIRVPTEAPPDWHLHGDTP